VKLHEFLFFNPYFYQGSSGKPEGSCYYRGSPGVPGGSYYYQSSLVIQRFLIERVLLSILEPKVLAESEVLVIIKVLERSERFLFLSRFLAQ